MSSGGCRSGMCGPRQGGGCGGGSCGAGQQRFPSQQGFHGGGQGGFQGGGAGAGSQVPGQSQGVRPYADADEVPAPSLDQQAATHEDPNENGDVKAGEILTESCQGCHSEAQKRTKSGKELKEFENWKKEDWERAIKAVESGRMPQGGKLSEEEKKNIIAYFKSQIAKEGLVAESKKEQKETKEETKEATQEEKEDAPRAPSFQHLPTPQQASVPQSTAPTFDALTDDLTQQTTGDLLIAREATKGIRFSQEEVQKEDQRREKIDAEISRRQQAGSRSRVPVLRPKRVVADRPVAAQAGPKVEGIEEAMNRLIYKMLLQQINPMNRFKTGEVEGPIDLNQLKIERR